MNPLVVSNLRRGLCLALLSVLFSESALADSEKGSNEWSRKVLRFNFTVRNLQGTPSGEENLHLYAPASTSNQKVVSIEASQPFAEKLDELGNRLLVFSFKELPPYATRKLSVSSTVDLAQTPPDDISSDTDVFSGDEPLIESDTQELKVLGRSFGDVASSEFVDRVYTWVRSNISYAGFIADDLGASYALRTRRGDCSEYAYLVAALNRSRGIPTRVLGGYVVQSSAVVKASEYHNWNEAYLNKKWRLIDAQKGVLFTPSNGYVITRIVSRFSTKPGSAFVHRYVNPEGGLNVEMD